MTRVMCLVAALGVLFLAVTPLAAQEDALVAVGDYLVVIARESSRPEPPGFEERVATPLRKLIERAQSLGEVRDDLPASWLMESLIGIVVSGLQTRPPVGVEDTVAGVTSLFLDGARLQAR